MFYSPQHLFIYKFPREVTQIYTFFVFLQFISFCEEALKKEISEYANFITLIRKRYEQCSAMFRNSPAMADLVDTTASKMKAEREKLFVHLKNFLAELKAKADKGGDGRGKKRQAEGMTGAAAKVRIKNLAFYSILSAQHIAG
jgi:hypothetical protein